MRLQGTAHPRAALPPASPPCSQAGPGRPCRRVTARSRRCRDSPRTTLVEASSAGCSRTAAAHAEPGTRGRLRCAAAPGGAALLEAGAAECERAEAADARPDGGAAAAAAAPRGAARPGPMAKRGRPVDAEPAAREPGARLPSALPDARLQVRRETPVLAAPAGAAGLAAGPGGGRGGALTSAAIACAVGTSIEQARPGAPAAVLRLNRARWLLATCAAPHSPPWAGLSLLLPTGRWCQKCLQRGSPNSATKAAERLFARASLASFTTKRLWRLVGLKRLCAASVAPPQRSCASTRAPRARRA